MKHLRNLEELRAWSQTPITLTVGFFDGVHRGHQHLLKQLCAVAQRNHACSLVVTFSNSPRAFHQHGGEWRYITLPEEKLAILAATGVDAVLMLEYTSAIAGQSGEAFLRELGTSTQICALVAGYDSSIGADMLSGYEQLSGLARQFGMDFEFVEPFDHSGIPVKSSLARELVANGEIRQVREILGHPYFVIGKVSAGKGKGGPQLHTPTANIVLPHEKIAPATGVYAGVAATGDRSYPAAIVVLSAAQAHNTVVDRNSDAGPSGGDPQRIIVETHLINYAGDLYGHEITVHFLERLRDFRDFGTTSDLIAQIKTDIARTLQIASQESALCTATEVPPCA